MAVYQPNEAQNSTQPTARVKQLRVRTDLQAGIDADCSQGLSYWRKEYNSLKKYAQSIGCA